MLPKTNINPFVYNNGGEHKKIEVYIIIIFGAIILFLISLNHAHKKDMYGHNMRHKNNKNSHRIFKSDGTSRIEKL